MKSIIRLVLVLLVLAIVAGGGYFLTHGEQPPAPVMIHRDLQPVAPAGPAHNTGPSAGPALPDLPPVGGH